MPLNCLQGSQKSIYTTDKGLQVTGKEVLAEQGSRPCMLWSAMSAGGCQTDNDRDSRGRAERETESITHA
jgi:hypothetical protein